VLRWLVEVGQPIRRGQPLLEIETDKATMEVESFSTGSLSAVHVAPGEEVEIGVVIATIEVEPQR
jgi:pyruvate dehydrogenase E2 component (dihydrolipoamide acetyltransferase)